MLRASVGATACRLLLLQGALAEREVVLTCLLVSRRRPPSARDQSDF